MSKVIFFELEDWQKDYLKKNYPTPEDLVLIDGPLLADRLPAEKETEIISVFVDSRLDEKVLSHFPNLKLIATRSTGFDHIDLDLCRQKGIQVANVPSYGEETVAEFTFALMLTLSRKVCESYDQVRVTGSFGLNGLRGFDLNGKTLGVIGTGRIGRNVIEIAKGFNMNIIAYDKFPDEEYAKKMGYRYLPFVEVLTQADIVTLHIPYTTENHHLLNTETIAQMKKGAYLINTARGSLVETDALFKALKNGHLAGAALDVLEEEGIVKDEMNFLSNNWEGPYDLKTVLQNHMLVDMPNVIVTPHNAFNTWEALKRILNTTIKNMTEFGEGRPVNIVSES
ncbi:MAG TPA: hydroxyacid dehydrogenase [Candidatus Paceibacterota bacterium]|jgi:D-lactate dehydrogenase|nr:hydroxyacid dehydrogenase [Candidatus Paceibacterota bacterium]HOH11208.1 hydroxyacid dehydrogenase [Candidatus Paceibacterota bacterium]HOY11053.1 hydroxyacid dehydrogenase [Candidatus Paceibacterota bacterium]HPY12981.1 hydroxyacid dehydrogenase [Candidatus Paceibacterota bacterium]